MNKDQLEHIKLFAESDAGSDIEKQFQNKELQGYFDEKLRKEYAKKLEHDFDVRNTKSELNNNEKTSRKTLFLSIFLACLLIITAIYFLSKNNEAPQKDLITAYKSELYTPIDFNIRGDIANVQTKERSIVQAYEEKDFETVIITYRDWKNSDQEIPSNIKQMAGIAFALLEEYDQATQLFNEILNTPESTYSNHATVRYLQGLVYLLQNDIPNAKNFLQKIKPTQYKYQEAQEIIKQY